MEKLLNNSRFVKQLKEGAELPIDWNQLNSKTLLITGASGMIGTYLIYLLMFRNENYENKINVIAVGRDENNAKVRFEKYWGSQYFQFVKGDVNYPLKFDADCDYIIHAASNTHPIQYSTDPIGTITTNVIGTKNILDYAVSHKTNRVLFLSSVEVYGENRGDTDKFEESYSGYIDCNTLRAGYPESKRLGEALCQAYIESKNLDIVIPRLSRVYGPTMLSSDSKAIAQFIKKAVEDKDIILKSEGNQLYSYTYVADAVSAILYLLLSGKSGQAYNVAGKNSDVTLKQLATMLADKAGTKVIFEMPEAKEQQGYSKATKATLDAKKLMESGWKSQYTMEDGIDATVGILRELQNR